MINLGNFGNTLQDVFVKDPTGCFESLQGREKTLSESGKHDSSPGKRWRQLGHWQDQERGLDGF